MKNLILIMFAVLLSFKTFALAEGVYTIIIQKQEEKQSSRWTLADWLVTKQKIALMDQWLALHSSTTWFEFAFDYGSANLDETIGATKTQYDMDHYGAAMYVKFLGFEYNKYKYSKLTSQSDYKFNLRLLGSSLQSTHVRAFYGKRDFEYLNYSKYSQDLYGVNLTLYLLSFFGGEITYTKFSKTTSADKLYSMDGQRVEYGAFIDLWLLRLYANKFIESSIFRSSSTVQKLDEGTIFGLKLFF